MIVVHRIVVMWPKQKAVLFDLLRALQNEVPLQLIGTGGPAADQSAGHWRRETWPLRGPSRIDTYNCPKEHQDRQESHRPQEQPDDPTRPVSDAMSAGYHP